MNLETKVKEQQKTIEALRIAGFAYDASIVSLSQRLFRLESYLESQGMNQDYEPNNGLKSLQGISPLTHNS